MLTTPALLARNNNKNSTSSSPSTPSNSNSIHTLKCDTSSIVADLIQPTCSFENHSIPVNNWQIERHRKATKLIMKNIQNENLPLNLADSFPNLVEISASSTTFRSLKRENFRFLRKLEVLQMENGELLRIRRDSFDDLVSLRILNFNGNFLTYLQPELFRNLENLEEFNINDNEIEELNPRIFRNLENLKIFSANGNKLSMITADFFTHNRKLSQISLNRNILRFIDSATFGGLKELFSVDLRENDCIDKEYSISKTRGGFIGMLKKDVDESCHITVKI